MLKSVTFLASALMAVTAMSANAQDTNRDTVVATVNGVEITLGQMIITRAQLPQQYQQLPPDVLFSGVLDQLINQQLLAEQQTTVPDRVTIALENERRSLMAGELINDLTKAALSDEAVQAAYDLRAAGLAPVQEYHAAHILVETEEAALAIVDRVTAGEDFAAIAQAESTDTGSGAGGGDLGWFSAGMMVPEFEAAVAAMTPDQLSAPIQTQFGWHVIKLIETREKPAPTLEELRAEIESGLQQTAITAKIDELTAVATITRPEEGAFDPAILNNLDMLED